LNVLSVESRSEENSVIFEHHGLQSLRDKVQTSHE
jgi:hypothetical protein